MRRTTLCHIFIIVIVVTAGCNAVDTLDDPFQADHSPTPTLTPAPVPTDGSTDIAFSRLAPGLTRYSMDAQVLAHAHNTTLHNTSFTTKVTRTATYPNGTVFSQLVEIFRVGDDGNTSYVFNRTVLPRSGPLQSANVVRYAEEWSGNTRGATKTTYANNTTTYSEHTSLAEGAEPDMMDAETITSADIIRRLFGGTETKAVNTTSRNGTTRYHVTTSVVRMPRGPPGVHLQSDAWKFKHINQATQHALISARGIVRDHHLNVTTTSGNTTLTVTVERQFSQIGTTAPNQPSWVQKTINESTTQTAVRSPEPTGQS